MPKAAASRPKRKSAASSSSAAAEADDGEFFSDNNSGSDYDEPKPPPKKRARAGKVATTSASVRADHDVTALLALTAEELEKTDKEQLVEYVTALQTALRIKQTASAAPPQMSNQQLAVEVAKAKKLMVNSIIRSMTWKPSCKTNGAKFSYSSILVDDRVLPVMIGLKATDRFKAKRFTADEFQKAVGDISSSARYSNLYLRSNVNVRWEQESRTFTVSGSYGVLSNHTNF